MSNALVPELAVSNWSMSRAFYCDILGFEVRYERPDEGFSFLALGDAELMIDQVGLGRTFAVDDAPLLHPFGRGINLQIRVPDVQPIIARLEAAGVAFYLPLEDKWYRCAAHETGNRQFAVADPDGYLLRLYQRLGERPIVRDNRLVEPELPSRANALGIATGVVRTRYAGAAFAYVAGSIMRGQGTYLSDIDLVVVHDRLENAYRESFLAEGVPVEAFVHDPQTLAWFFEADASNGRPVMLNMVAEGVVVGHATEPAERIRQAAVARLAQGPAALTPAALNALRYEITDAIDDLRAPRPAAETLAIGAALHSRLVELALRGRGRWHGTGKWAPRLLGELDSALAERFDAAFRALFAAADAAPLIRLAENELEPHGGFLFAGDHRRAPAIAPLQPG